MINLENIKGCWVINVPHNKYGYSFAVSVKNECTENEILNICLEKGLFEENIDAEYADIEPMTEYDYNYWQNQIYYLD